MKSLRELLGLRDVPLQKQADTLVQVAELNAITLLMSLEEKFSFLREVDAKHCHFTLTIASVFVAINQLVNLGLGQNRERELMAKVGAKLTQWSPVNGRRFFEDCASFYEKTYNPLADEPRLAAFDSLGFWVVWNV